MKKLFFIVFIIYCGCNEKTLVNKKQEPKPLVIEENQKLNQDNVHFYWDSAHSRLGIGDVPLQGPMKIYNVIPIDPINTHNDSKAIQEAINEASKIDKRVVYFPEGIYPIGTLQSSCGGPVVGGLSSKARIHITLIDTVANDDIKK